MKTSQFPGHMGILDGAGDDSFDIHEDSNGGLFDMTVVSDNTGNDTFYIEQGARIFIRNDGDAASSNTLVFEGVDPNDLKLVQISDDLYFYNQATNKFIGVSEDHFASDGPGVSDLVVDYQGNLTQKSLLSLDSADLFNIGLNILPDWLVNNVLPLIDTARNEVSPLILDLDGDGIELISLNSSSAVYWDLDQDGMAEATGWAAGDDGLLAYDWNGDGAITEHSELFGSATIDGFAILSTFDSNGDGVITTAANDNFKIQRKVA